MLVHLTQFSLGVYPCADDEASRNTGWEGKRKRAQVYNTHSCIYVFIVRIQYTERDPRAEEQPNDAEFHPAHMEKAGLVA